MRRGSRSGGTSSPVRSASRYAAGVWSCGTGTWPCGMEEVKHSTQKERRICETLEPVMNSHRLVVDRDLIQRDYDSTAGYASAN